MNIKEIVLWTIITCVTFTGFVSCFSGPDKQPKQVMVLAQEQQLIPGALVGDPTDPSDDLVSVAPEDFGFNPILKADGTPVKFYIVPSGLVNPDEQVINLEHEGGLAGWATDPDTYWGLLDVAKSTIPGAAATFAGVEVLLGIFTPRKRELYKKAVSEAGLSTQEMISAVKVAFQALGATHSRDDTTVVKDGKFIIDPNQAGTQDNTDSATTLHG